MSCDLAKMQLTIAAVRMEDKFIVFSVSEKDALQFMLSLQAKELLGAQAVSYLPQEQQMIVFSPDIAKAKNYFGSSDWMYYTNEKLAVEYSTTFISAINSVADFIFK